jgi:hypothetical protein
MKLQIIPIKTIPFTVLGEGDIRYSSKTLLMITINQSVDIPQPR